MSLTAVSDRFEQEYSPDWLGPAVVRLLGQCGRGPDFQLVPLSGGANNRVFRVQLADERVLLKWYFADSADPRDRLQAEWEFTEFAWQHGVRQIPQPLACDRGTNLAAYQFLEGRPIAPRELTLAHVRAATEFCLAINRFRDVPEAGRLGAASEACFSLEQHLRTIDARVRRMAEAVLLGSMADAARSPVAQRLVPRWREVEGRIREEASRQDFDMLAELPTRSRILSPSDFGFHNALLDATNELRFFDFEYAGWDDPAKAVCDFFCQIAVPVPPGFFPDFVGGLSDGLSEPSRLRQRAELLLPAYQVKWCCIVLNPLLSVGRRQRAFSRGTVEEAHAAEESLAALDKARRILDNMAE